MLIQNLFDENEVTVFNDDGEKIGTITTTADYISAIPVEGKEIRMPLSERDKAIQYIHQQFKPQITNQTTLW
jgi:hypothetical protein